MPDHLRGADNLIADCLILIVLAIVQAARWLVGW